jgi:hypothetical protein
MDSDAPGFLERHKLAVSIVVALAIRISAIPFIGSTVCSDGWASHSIGSPGACSWHGGVAMNGGSFLANIISVGVGLAIWAHLYNQQQKRRADAIKAENAAKQTKGESNLGVVRCLGHGLRCRLP